MITFFQSAKSLFFKPTVTHFYFFILLLCSCNNGTNQERTSAPALAARAALADSTLDVLYLTNFPDSPQLQNLNTLISHPHPYKKFIFQFLHTPDGKLTLGIWPAEQRDQDFDSTNLVVLKNLGPSATVINKDSIYLGDQQFADTAWRKRNFDTLINKPNARYLTFYPVIQNKHVVYQIRKASSLIEKVGIANSPIATLNPSPPYSAY